MRNIKYFLQGFGFRDTQDFKHSTFKLLVGSDGVTWSMWSIVFGIITEVTGLQGYVFVAFVVLIFLEFWMGLRVSLRIKKQKIQSRRMGRMTMKVLVYIIIVSLLNAFTKQVEIPDIFGFDMNPFVWLYYAVFIGIVFQLVVSLFENLSQLGYKEIDPILKAINKSPVGKHFEFNGEKDNSAIDEAE